MTPYCIECGTPKLDDDPRYDEWGGYVIGNNNNGGWVHLCPAHYREHLEKIKRWKTLARYCKMVIKRLKREFPNSIEWLENKEYKKGCEHTGRNSDVLIFNRRRDRMRKMIEVYNEEVESDIFISDKAKEHIKKLLFKKCSVCRFWGEGNYCHKLNRPITEILLYGFHRGNFGGCDDQEVQISMTKCISEESPEFDLRKELTKWKKKHLDIDDPWLMLRGEA